MDPKQIFVGLLLIGGAVYFLQPDKKAAEVVSAAAPAPKAGIGLGGGLFSPFGGGGAPVYDGSNPEVLRTRNVTGYHYASPALLRAGEAMGIVSDLVEGIGPDNASGMPTALQAIAAPADCAYQRAWPGNQVAAVHLYSGGAPSNAHLYTDRLVARAALRGLRNHKSSRAVDVTDNGSIVEMPETTALRQVDVVVNMPGAPVHLVLQDRSGGVLWNLLPTAATRLGQVTVLSGGYSGVINLPQGVALQGENLALDASCSGGAHPVEPPPPEAAPREGYSVSGARVTNHRLRSYDPYGEWFTKTFGHSPSENAVWAASASHVLVGEMPAAEAPKLDYRSAAGSTLHVIPAPLTYVATPEEHESWLRDRAVQMLAAAYGVAPDADLGALMRAATSERIQ